MGLLEEFFSFENYYFGKGREQDLITRWEKQVIESCSEKALEGLKFDDKTPAMDITKRYEECTKI